VITITNKTIYIHMNNIVEIIKSEGEIHKFDLIERANISLSTYEKLKPWIEHKFAEIVRYDKSTKKWISIVYEDQEMNNQESEIIEL